jgi:hypothetical protein
MTTPESTRLDLYNGLQELLGTDRARYLVTHLLPVEESDLLTRTEFETEMSGLRTELSAFKQEMSEQFDKIDGRFDRLDEKLDKKLTEVHKRIDRVLLAVVGGMFLILAAVISSGVWS